MNRFLFSSSSLAAAGVFIVCAALAAPASAQSEQPRYPQDRHFDGFCYVHADSVQASTETDYWGTRRGYGRCYRGEYYIYTNGYTTAPRAPDGFVARYFTRRPDRAFYDRVYNAATLTETFDADADYRDDSGRDAGSGYDRDRRYDRTREYPADSYARPDADSRYDDRDRRADQQRSDERTSSDQVGQYEESAPSDDYARDSRTPDANGYVAPYDARQSQDTEGWQDDQGAWHLGRPRAIGWQDDNGQWHEGQVQTYGRRDRNGQWHETQGDAGGQ